MLVSVAILGVVRTAVAFLVFFALIAEVGPLRAKAITAVALALGVALLGEPSLWAPPLASCSSSSDCYWRQGGGQRAAELSSITRRRSCLRTKLPDLVLTPKRLGGHHLALADGAVHQPDVPTGADRARLAGETVQ